MLMVVFLRPKPIIFFFIDMLLFGGIPVAAAAGAAPAAGTAFAGLDDSPPPTADIAAAPEHAVIAAMAGDVGDDFGASTLAVITPTSSFFDYSVYDLIDGVCSMYAVRIV